MAETKNDGGTIFIRIILLLIPVINIIATLLWAFASQDEGTRKFGKTAFLILLLIVLISFLFGVYGLFSLKGSLFA